MTVKISESIVSIDCSENVVRMVSAHSCEDCESDPRGMCETRDGLIEMFLRVVATRRLVAPQHR